ncbi:hypothetical protein BH10ACT1_BH10ACT1_15040 [soil metagenome]
MNGAEPSRRVTAALLLVLVLVGGGLRCWNLDWDRGAHLHPDERYLAIVSSEVSAPDGVGGWFDTGRSPLNPENHDQRFVYGTAPLLLTKGVASWLEHGADTGAQPARAVTVGLDRVGVDLLDHEGRPRFDGGYDSVLVGRLLSALLDTLTIVVVFGLGRSLGGRRTGLAAALVWATCALAIQHAHFFVVEPMLTLATASALLAAVEVARGRGRWVLAAGGAAAGLAGASKISGLAVLAVLAAAGTVRRWSAVQTSWSGGGAVAQRLRRSGRAVRPLLVDGAIVAGAAFVVLRVLQPYMFDGLFGLDDRWRSTLRDLQLVQQGGDVPPNVQWATRVPVLEPLGHLVRFGFGLPATALVLAAVVRLRRRRAWTDQPVMALLVGWVVLVSAIFLPRFTPAMRYLLPAYPALAALAGVGACRLLAGGRAARVMGVGALALAVLWGFAFTHGVYGRPQTRIAASAWLVEHAPAGSVLSYQSWDDGLPLPSAAATAKAFTTEQLEPFAIETPDDVRKLAASLDRVDYVVESSDRITATVTRIPGRYAPVLRYYDALADGSLGFERVASFSSGPELLGLSIADDGSEEAFRVYDHPPVGIWQKTDRFTLRRALAILQPDRASAAEHVPLDEGTSNGLLLRRDADDPGNGPTFDDVFPDRLPAPWLWWLAWWELTALAALPWVTRLFGAVPDRGIGVAKVLGPLAVVVPLWALVAFDVVAFSASSAWAVTVLAVAGGLAVPAWRRDARTLVREHRRALLAVELLTLGVFGAVLLLRMANPDLWYHPTGGEKPFNTAYFTSVARSSSFPPADPWFSGGSMNYYYGGWFTLAVPARALGIPPEIALNLAIATIASLVAAVGWSITTGLHGLRRAASGPVSVAAGFLGAGALLAVGNLTAARQGTQRLREAVDGRVAPSFDWWATSRVNPGTTDINEFPAWTVLFGDPHAHLIALPVLLSLVAVLGTYVATRHHGSRGAATGLAGLAGIGVAWTRIGHTWDLPTVVLLTISAIVVGSAIDPTGGRRRWRTGALHLGLAGILAFVVGLPYTRASQVFDSGFVRATAHTPVPSFLLQLGVPLGLAACFLLARWLGAARQGSLPVLFRPLRGQVGLVLGVVGALVLVAAVVSPSGALAAAVVAGCLASAVVDLRAGEVGRALAAGLVAAGAGLAAVPERYVVLNDLGRMNTVFKFGYTAWALLAVGSAVLVLDLVVGADHRRLARLGLVLVALPGLLFWPSATAERLDARFAHLPLTLDGRAWLHHGPLVVETSGIPPVDLTGDNALVGWLRANVRSGDTIVEEAGQAYTWAGRISIATGLPTVIGWPSHQSQQRRGYGSSVDERYAAVIAFYDDPDPVRALRFLAAYRPDYVVVGTVERAVGSPAALEALPERTGLRRVWARGAAAVYRVDHRAIDERLAVIDARRIRAGLGLPPPPA